MGLGYPLLNVAVTPSTIIQSTKTSTFSRYFLTNLPSESISEFTDIFSIIKICHNKNSIFHNSKSDYEIMPSDYLTSGRLMEILILIILFDLIKIVRNLLKIEN